MLAAGILFTTAALMALVAVACTALCIAWTNPAWRRRLALGRGESEVCALKTGGLSGWPARVGSGIISAGIAACALVAWYGLYWALAALG
jgi:hypothetical protein